MLKKPSHSLTTSGDSHLSDWPFKRPCTKEELAEQVRCTKRFLEHEVNRGHLRAVRLGLRSVRFLPSDVVRWLNARPIAGSEEGELSVLK
jgi:excisionase family DNA binding protein